MATTIAGIAVEIGAEIKQLTSGLNEATGRLKKFGNDAQKIGKDLTTKLTLPIVGIGAALVKSASDAEETESKFKTVFKDVAKEAKNAQETLRTQYGLSRKESQKLLSDTGDLLSGFGFAGDAALDTSLAVQKLAVDLASFTNVEGGAQRASEALSKALLGEREMIKAYSVAILDADVSQRLMEKGQDKLTGTALKQAKAIATLELAYEQSKNAIGDFQRTSDSFSNQFRILQQDINDVAVEFGKILLPAAKELVVKFREILKWVDSLSPATKEYALKIAGLAAVIGPLVATMGFLATNVLPGLVIAFQAATGPIGLVITAIAGVTAAIIAMKMQADTVRTLWENMSLEDLQYQSEKAVKNIERLEKSLDEAHNNAKDLLSTSPEWQELAEKAEGWREELEKSKKDLAEINAAIDKKQLSKEMESAAKGTSGLNLGLDQVITKLDTVKKQAVDLSEHYLKKVFDLGSQSFQLESTLATKGPSLLDAPDMFAGMGGVIEEHGRQVKQLGEGYKNLGLQIADTFASSIGHVNGFADAAKTAAHAVVKSLVAEGVAAMIRNVMMGPQALALGPGAIALAAVAGKAASGLFSSLVPKFAFGGMHSGGFRVVGEHGPELEATGPARYTSNHKLKNMFGGGMGNGQLVARVSGSDLEFVLQQNSVNKGYRN